MSPVRAALRWLFAIFAHGLAAAMVVVLAGWHEQAVPAGLAWCLVASGFAVTLMPIPWIGSPDLRRTFFFGATSYRLLHVLLGGAAVQLLIPEIYRGGALLFWGWVVSLYLTLLAMASWMLFRHSANDFPASDG